MSETAHHLFCNGDPRSPVKGCRWCDPDGDGKRGMWAKYPILPGDTAHSLVARHFPDAIPLSSDFPLPRPHARTTP